MPKVVCSLAFTAAVRSIRIEKDGTRTTLADRFEGKRLNSPNDLVVARDGTVYFTDPSFGLEGMDNSPLREQTFNGVYRLRPNGEITLLTREQERPNGLVLSPDGSILVRCELGRRRHGLVRLRSQSRRPIEQTRVLRSHRACKARVVPTG